MKMIFGFILVLSVPFASADQFQPIFKDKSNALSWGAALPGTYSNGCGNVENILGKCFSEVGLDGWNNVTLEDSSAAKACHDIGARLPTLDEYESLKANFDHTFTPKGYLELTANGESEVQAVFKDMPNTFWTSTLRTAGPNGYNGYEAYTYTGRQTVWDVSFDLRPFKYAVRCVAKI